MRFLVEVHGEFEVEADSPEAAEAEARAVLDAGRVEVGVELLAEAAHSHHDVREFTIEIGGH